jgi:tubulin-like protein CetZ
MIGFIGLGAAGGNIADEAVKQEYPGIAINYSQKDLDSLEYVKERLRLIGSEGVGKNREEAIRLMGNNWESAVSFIKERYSSPAIEIIFVCFATGGGSGSGMAPVLLELLMNEMEDKTFVAVPILPDLSEVMVNQLNSIQAFEELSDLNICVLPIDNEEVKGASIGIGKNGIYQKANTKFVKIIREIIEYTNRNSKNGVLDKRDLRTIFDTKGIATISKLNISVIGHSDLTEEGIADSIQHSWDRSIFTPIQRNKIIRAGIIFDGQEALMPFIRFEKIFNVFKSGMPLDLFEGYYEEKKGVVYSLLSGLPWCRNRLEKVEEIINKKQSATEGLMEEEGYHSKVNDFATKIRSSAVKKKSVADILSRYRK